jgi:purine-cytosine permease-like protein
MSAEQPRKKLKFGGREFPLPRSQAVRITIGVFLIIIGLLGGWLPILGYWMVPAGLLILSVDIPAVRRGRRNFDVWFGRTRFGQWVFQKIRTKEAA